MKKIKEFYETSPEIFHLLIFILIGAILVFLTNSFFVVFAPFIMSYLVTRLLYPLLKWLKKIKIPNIIGTLFCMLIFGLAATFIIWIFGHYIVEGITYLINTLSSQDTINSVIAFAQDLGVKIEELIKFANIEINTSDIASLITDLAKNAITALSNLSISIATQVPGILMAFIIGCVAAFYMLYDYEKLSNTIDRQLSDRTRKFLDVINNQVLSSFMKMILSYIIISTVCFLELVIGFYILGIQDATFIALIIAILDVLPILGSGAVLLPWGIITIIIGNPFVGIGLLVLWGVITVVRQILEPKIVGSTIGLHPLLTLASLYIGLRLIGGLGLIIGPLYVISCKKLNESGVIKLYKNQPNPTTLINKNKDKFEQDILSKSPQDSKNKKP